MLNLQNPVSSIMTTKLFTVNPHYELQKGRAIFAKHNIHHIPVVEGEKLLGIISKADFLAATTLFSKIKRELQEDEDLFLTTHVAEEIMTRGLAKVEPTYPISVVVHLFTINFFHALPVTDDDGNLLGIVTPLDILRNLDDNNLF